MQLICPKCDARYLISSSALGAEGREVRCAKCAHEWFETPDNLQEEDASVDNFADNPVDEAVEESNGLPSDDVNEPEPEQEQETVTNFDDIDDGADDSFDMSDKQGEPEEIAPEKDVGQEEEDIPDSVKPIDDGAAHVPAFAEDVVKPKAGLQAKLMGYIAALLIFSGLIAGAFIFKQNIISAWMPSAAIYELAGFPVQFQGQNLVIENLSAKAQKDVDGQNFLLLQGRVINLTNEVQDVPPLMARLRSTNGEDGKPWHIETPLKKLDPGESFIFKSDYPALPDGSGSVNLSFKPTLKK